MKTFCRTRAIILTQLALVFGFLALCVPIASAASPAISIYAGRGCISGILDAPGNTVNVGYGENVTLTVLNQDEVVAQNVSGPGISTQLQHSGTGATPGTYSHTFNLGSVTSAVVISFTPVPNSEPYNNACPLGSNPVSSSLTINPASAPAPTPAPSSTPKPKQNSSPAPTPTASTSSPAASATTTTPPQTVAPTANSTPNSGGEKPLTSTKPQRKVNPLIIAGGVIGIAASAAVLVWLLQRRKIINLKRTRTKFKRRIKKLF